MSNEIIKTEDKSLVEFVPFGASDKVKLSIGIVRSLVAVPTKSGKQCSDKEALKFIAMCHARRLNPFEGDAYLIGYDGKDGPTFSLITAHQAFLKRAEVNPEYDGMKSGIIVDRSGEVQDLEGDFYLSGDKLLGGWATVFFKNRKQPMHKRVRLERFKKPFGIWLDDAAGMICKCAEADALRSSFPTMLGGLYLKEEVQPVEAAPSRPMFTPTVIDASEPQTEPPPPAPEPEPETPNPPKAAALKSDATPAPPEKPTGYNRTKAVSGLIKLAGLKDDEVCGYLVEIGAAEEGVKTITDLAVRCPDTFDILDRQHGEIFQKIKEAKGTK